MDAVDRVRVLETLESVNRTQMAKMTGISSSKWNNCLLRKQRMFHEDLVLLANNFPEYKVWLLTGMEIPSEGHISPLSKNK